MPCVLLRSPTWCAPWVRVAPSLPTARVTTESRPRTLSASRVACIHRITTAMAEWGQGVPVHATSPSPKALARLPNASVREQTDTTRVRVVGASRAQGEGRRHVLDECESAEHAHELRLAAMLHGQPRGGGAEDAQAEGAEEEPSDSAARARQRRLRPMARSPRNSMSPSPRRSTASALSARGQPTKQPTVSRTQRPRLSSTTIHSARWPAGVIWLRYDPRSSRSALAPAFSHSSAGGAMTDTSRRRRILYAA